MRTDGRYWYLLVEPQVRARAKRVFPRMDQKAGDLVTISNVPEHCRDLEWFIQRYPVDVSPEHLDALRQGAEQHRDMEVRLADLLAARIPPAHVELAKPAREYQLFAATACEIRGGLLLADDVGVGKTISGIIPMMDARNLPATFVCESHLARQMESKLLEFAPGLQTHRVRKGSPYELRTKRPRLSLRPDRLPDVFVISYHMLRGWADLLGEIVRYNVFDECQRLRSSASQIYGAAQHVAGKARMNMGLSATPIYNYGSEFFWVVNCLLPGALGTRAEFVREWCGDGQFLTDTDRFGNYLRREGIMIRRTRRDVGREIPECQRIPHMIETDHKVLEKLTGDAANLARIILSHNEQFRGQLMQASGEFDALMRQATGVAKAPYVAEFVRLLIESGETVIVFAWHREVYRILCDRLKEHRPLMYTGSESPAQKEQVRRMMIKRERSLLLMSLRAGAGVDGLQEICRTGVFAEIDWSPGVHDQCIGRFHRDGQPEPVVAYFLLSDDGTDPIMAEVNGIKLEQREGVINPGGPLVERIETGEHHLRRLARELLERRGEPIPEPKEPA